VKYVYCLLLLLDMYDGMFLIYICMWFEPTFCLVMLSFFFQVGKVLFFIVEMHQILFCKFQSICVELYINTCGQIGVKSQCSTKSRGKLSRVNLSFVNIFNTVTGSSQSRGKLKLRFNKVGVKMH
jgi:hypothetical protein